MYVIVQGYPVLSPGAPDQGLPTPPPIPGYPLPTPPTDPGWGGGWGAGGHPSQGLPWSPGHPSHGLPWAPGHPSHGLPSPGYPTGGPVFPPIYPVDPSWGVGAPGMVQHPLLWLLPWLIKPATSQQSVPPPPTTPKPDPDKPYSLILVAVGPGAFRWAWLETMPTTGAPEPK